MSDDMNTADGNGRPDEADVRLLKLSDVSATIYVGMDKNGVISKYYDMEIMKAVQLGSAASFSWVDQTVTDTNEALAVALRFGFSRTMIGSLQGGQQSAYLDRDTELGLKIPSVRVLYVDPVVEPIFFLIRDNLILTIHGLDCPRLVQFSRYADVFLRKQTANISLEERRTHFLIRLMDENLNDHFDQLRYIEDHADDISSGMSDWCTNVQSMSDRIFQVKHSAIVYLGTLWRTLDVVNALRFGDAELIDDNQRNLSRLNMMIEDINRQIELAENMSDVLVSGMKVMQAIHNNQMQVTNNKMVLALTWMTIFGTALLVPNTIATIMGYAFTVDHILFIWSMLVMVMATGTMSYLAFWWVRTWSAVPKSPEELLA